MIRSSTYALHIGAAFLLLFSLSISLGSTNYHTHGVFSVVLVSSGDFSFSASPGAISVGQGNTATSTITISGQGGYLGNVTLLVAETYDSINMNVGLTPSTVRISAAQSSATSTLQVSAYSSARPGDYTISLVADDGTIQHYVQIALHVTGQSMTINSSPTRLTFPVKQNTSLSTTIIFSSLGGFSGNLNLTVSIGSSFPGVTQEPSVSPSSAKISITPSAPASIQLAIDVNSSMIAAPYSARIDEVNPPPTGIVRLYEFVFNVGPDFNLTDGMRNMIVHQGAMSIATVTVTSLNGFKGPIGMYAGPISVNPPNPDIRFYPPSVTLSSGGTGITHIAVRADAHTGLGTYSVFIEASDVSGATWLGESLPFNVTVLGPVTGPDFTIYADPAHAQTSIGSTVTSTINMVGDNGFTGPVTLFADYGTGASLNPVSVSLLSRVNVTSTLTVNIPAPNPNGIGGDCSVWWYNCGGQAVIVVASDSTGFSHWTWVNITATPFSVVASPARQVLKAGSASTFNVTVNGIGKFNDTVTLSTVSQGVAASLSNSLLNFSGAPNSLSSNLTVSVPLGTPAGDYVIQITGTYMRPAYICFCAPKYPLSYSVPIDVLVASTASSAPTIFGLQPVEFYVIVAAAAAVIVIATSNLVFRKRKHSRTSNG